MVHIRTLRVGLRLLRHALLFVRQEDFPPVVCPGFSYSLRAASSARRTSVRPVSCGSLPPSFRDMTSLLLSSLTISLSRVATGIRLNCSFSFGGSPTQLCSAFAAALHDFSLRCFSFETVARPFPNFAFNSFLAVVFRSHARLVPPSRLPAHRLPIERIGSPPFEDAFNLAVHLVRHSTVRFAPYLTLQFALCIALRSPLHVDFHGITNITPPISTRAAPTSRRLPLCASLDTSHHILLGTSRRTSPHTSLFPVHCIALHASDGPVPGKSHRSSLCTSPHTSLGVSHHTLQSSLRCLFVYPQYTCPCQRSCLCLCLCLCPWLCLRSRSCLRSCSYLPPTFALFTVLALRLEPSIHMQVCDEHWEIGRRRRRRGNAGNAAAGVS